MHLATLGISNFFYHDPYQFCKKQIPNFIGKYSNNVNPSRTCIHYQYYTCHINHYCNGDKSCELDAQNYWLKQWHDIKSGKLLDPKTATKEICEVEISKCNSATKNDQTCRR